MTRALSLESSLPSLSLAESNCEDYASIVLLRGCLHLHMRFSSTWTENLWWHRPSLSRGCWCRFSWIKWL